MWWRDFFKHFIVYSLAYVFDHFIPVTPLLGVLIILSAIWGQLGLFQAEEKLDHSKQKWDDVTTH